jgi:hypothetical protein
MIVLIDHHGRGPCIIHLFGNGSLGHDASTFYTGTFCAWGPATTAASKYVRFTP